MRFEILHADKSTKSTSSCGHIFDSLCVFLKLSLCFYFYLSIYLYLRKKVFNSDVITATSTHANSVITSAIKVSLDGPSY